VYGDPLQWGEGDIAIGEDIGMEGKQKRGIKKI
jgi:hypothetical protein